MEVVVCMYVCMYASTAGPPQGHRGGGGVHNTPTSNTEANNPTDPGNTTTQHHRATGGGRGIPTMPYTMRGGGVGVATLYHIYIYNIQYMNTYIYKHGKRIKAKQEVGTPWHGD